MGDFHRHSARDIPKIQVGTRRLAKGTTTSVVSGELSDRRTIHRRIAEAREAAGLSQSQLASRVGVSQQAVSSWESSSVPSAHILRKLCRELNLDFAEVTDSIENGRGPLARRVTASTQDEAIAALRDEVSEMRRTIESLTQELRRQRPPASS